MLFGMETSFLDGYGKETAGAMHGPDIWGYYTEIPSPAPIPDRGERSGPRMSKPRILLEGIGGVGGVFAGRLIAAGFEPVLVTHNPAITAAIAARGVRAKTPESEVHAAAAPCTRLEEAAAGGPYAMAFLMMKSQGVVDAAVRTLPLLEPGGVLVTFQNGIVEDAVAPVIGMDRIVSVIVAWGATMHEPGVYEKTTPGATHLGMLDGCASPRFDAVRGAVAAVTQAIVRDNMRGALWGKLAINAAMTTMGALLAQPLGPMLANAQARRLFLRVYTEVIDTCAACGVHVEGIAADPMLFHLPRKAGLLSRVKKDLTLRYFGHKYRDTKGSMLQSLERGRPTEIAYLNGYVVEKAREHGLQVPLNAALVRMIGEIEAGQRAIGLHNLPELAAAQ